MPNAPELRAPQALPLQADHPGRLLCAARTPGWSTELGRRVSAGIRPEPGAHAGAPAWRGPDQWLLAVAADTASDPDGLREHHVAGGTVLLVARAMAPYADRVTGRECRPTNERVLAAAQVSLATLKRARAWLRSRGLVVELVRGKSILSRSERLRVWRAGSSHRQLASEFALTLPRRLAAIIHKRPAQPVRHEPPPGYSEGETVKSPKREFLTGTNRDRMSPTGRNHKAGRGPGPNGVTDARTRRLTAALQRRVPWLRDVSPRRLTILRRFAAQGWTERDVMTATDEVLRARGWTVPKVVTQPAAYLAALLREVDPADRPGALLDALADAERARRAELAHRSTLPECEHGEPAGDVPNARGLVECPLCRAAARRYDSRP